MSATTEGAGDGQGEPEVEETEAEETEVEREAVEGVLETLEGVRAWWRRCARVLARCAFAADENEEGRERSEAEGEEAGEGTLAGASGNWQRRESSHSGSSRMLALRGAGMSQGEERMSSLATPIFNSPDVRVWGHFCTSRIVMAYLYQLYQSESFRHMDARWIWRIRVHLG